MPIREAPIHRRADHCLADWRAGLDEDRLYFMGREKDGRYQRSGYIEFFDSEQQIGLDHNGEAWLIPDDKVSANASDACTAEIHALMRQRRDKRSLPPLTSDQLALLKKLTSKNV